MDARAQDRQPDLFAVADAAEVATLPADPDDRDLLDLARRDLDAMLALARGAARLPWADYTQAAVAELRFDGLAGHLPEAEGAALRAAFAAELDRLYALETEPE
ncbi:hypothetical protein J5Y09_00665 [Roseomonas sp. PWR1]|uniref:Uncharacterized protein n=1 Tax=Roseomonas nitratireducens TaxID=2820810 RepID=A0ABS4AM23_9PROT|nr:hypothetical protein [Neoroseomonas nitratireducens]MBP0462408.1 hypothetical protein [Neoroseomonas nitratireducens]